MSTKKGNGKCAVVLLQTPADFRPTHLHAVPLEISGARFYVRRLRLTKALSVAQEFNRHHLPCNGHFASEWAGVLYSLKDSALAAVRANNELHSQQANIVAPINAELVRHLAQRFSDFSFQLKRYAERLGDGVAQSDLHSLMVQVRESVNALPEASEVTENLSTIVDILPATESQAAKSEGGVA